MTRPRFIPAWTPLAVGVAIAILLGGTLALPAVRSLGHQPVAGFHASPRRPNVLIVVLDTVRYDATSMGGGGHTPFLQSVADRGFSFSRAYSTHDSTPESHFSLFTGQRDGYGTFPDRADMALAGQLRARGYDTFGIAANGNLSNRWGNMLFGFSRYVCLYDEWEAMPPAKRKAALPDIDARLDEYDAKRNDWNQSRLYASADRVVGRLHAWLAGTREPFFGFVNLIDAHDPYLPSSQSLGHESAAARRVSADLRDRKLRFPLTNPATVADVQRREWLLERLGTVGGRAWVLPDDLQPVELDTYKARYAASVKDADDAVRRIFGELEQRHVLDHTWVVVVADHGESFGEWGYLTHSLGDKGDPEATRHVPMVWAPPTPLTHGVTFDEGVTLMDVAPTLYDLVGIDWSSIRARAVGEFGRSLGGYMSDSNAVAAAAAPATTASQHFTNGPPQAQEQQEIRERLRALGYLR